MHYEAPHQAQQDSSQVDVVPVDLVDVLKVLLYQESSTPEVLKLELSQSNAQYNAGQFSGLRIVQLGMNCGLRPYWLMC